MGRDFDRARAGGPVRRLSTTRIKVTNRGIDAVARHVARFGDDPANRAMIDRLRRIARGDLGPTPYDLNFYSHELREFVRYRRLGFPTGGGDDYDLWNNAHSATLEDYDLSELDELGNRNLFHPDAWPSLPHRRTHRGPSMAHSSTARLTFLRLIGEHEGEWSWYQFERAFPPGWFAAEAPETRAMDILRGLERDGLVAATPGGPQPRYRLTEQGRDALRESAVGSTTD